MSTRSNENRLGVAPDPPKINSGNTNQPEREALNLNFITPTEFVELPSKGAYYLPTHPLHNKKVIEVKHMTTKEEDILTSTALLKNGLAIHRLLENIIVDKNIKVEDLLLGDKNALIIAARTHGYGPNYETVVSCPTCTEQQEYGFDLSSLKINETSKEEMDEKNIKTTEQNTFLIPLPKIDYTVEVRLLTDYDEKSLSKISEHKKKRKLPESPITDFLRAIIVSVNEIDDSSSLNSFVNSLPALHARYIRRVYDSLVPNLDLSHEFNCSNCNYEGILEVPLTADFFWPNA